MAQPPTVAWTVTKASAREKGKVGMLPPSSHPSAAAGPRAVKPSRRRSGIGCVPSPIEAARRAQGPRRAPGRLSTPASQGTPRTTPVVGRGSRARGRPRNGVRPVRRPCMRTSTDMWAPGFEGGAEGGDPLVDIHETGWVQRGLGDHREGRARGEEGAKVREQRFVAGPGVVRRGTADAEGLGGQPQFVDGSYTT